MGLYSVVVVAAVPCEPASYGERGLIFLFILWVQFNETTTQRRQRVHDTISNTVGPSTRNLFHAIDCCYLEPKPKSNRSHTN